MDKKSKIFLTLTLIFLLLSVAANFYKSVILQNFDIVVFEEDSEDYSEEKE